MSVIQSQCAVACSTMPLHIKFFTTASLAPKGIIKGPMGEDGEIIDCSRITFPSTRVSSPISPSLAQAVVTNYASSVKEA